MKKDIINISLFTCLLLFISACQQEEITPKQTEKPLPIEVELDLDGFKPSTRAKVNGTSTEDIYEFYLLVENPSDPDYNYSVKMSKYSSNDWRAYDIGTTNHRKLYFKNASDPVHIKAVHWREDHYKKWMNENDDSWTRPYNIFLNRDVSYTDAYILANDPVYANTTIIPKESCPNGKLRLSFRHLFAKVKFTVKIPFTKDTRKYITAESSPISNLKVEGLYGTVPNGKYLNWVAASNEINKPERMVSGPITITRYKWTPFYELTTDYLLMAIPQDIANGTFKVSFQFEEKTYNWTCQETNFRFETNKEYEITLQMITETRSASRALHGTIQEGGKQ